MEDGKKYVAFLRSYYDAMQELPRKTRAELALAIVEYGFDGKIENISGTAKAVFLAIKPTLDESNKKAAAARSGWKSKNDAVQEQCSSSANAVHVHSIEHPFLIREREGDRERERDRDKPPIAPHEGGEGVVEEKPPVEDALFSEFWEAYPKKIGKGAARKAFLKLPRETQRLLRPAVLRQRESAQWQRENGQYIPNPLTWINQCRWEDEVQEEPKTTNPFLRLMQEEARERDAE